MTFIHRFSLAIFILLTPLGAYGESYDPVAVYLTWDSHPESTMVVQWISDADHEEDMIDYQEAGECSWQSAMGSHTEMPYGPHYLIHRVFLTGLTPETNYIFRVSSDGVPFKFRTMPLNPTKAIQFVVGGDMYHDNELKVLIETNRMAASTGPDFGLAGGDIAYAGKKDKKSKERVENWILWLKAWKEHMVTPDGRLIPMVTALGNHDVNGRYNQTPEQAQGYYALFQRGYHALDFGNYLSILALDSDHTHPIDGDQKEWLYGMLEERQHIPHTFAFYHIPAYPSVRKLSGKVSTRVRDHWVPIFEKFGLAAAFEHHDHSYKRTLPILGDEVNTKKGVVYIGDGAWGIRKPRKPRKPEKAWYLAASAAKRHFVLVTLKANSRTFAAIGADGQVIDQYTQ